jgi:hypothetical protein
MKGGTRAHHPHPLLRSQIVTLPENVFVEEKKKLKGASPAPSSLSLPSLPLVRAESRVDS